MKKIILFSNTCWSLYNFRVNLIQKLIKKKFKVYILSNRDQTSKKLTKLGCIFYEISIDRRGVDSFNEISCLLKIYRKIKKISPDYLFNFTIKPIIYGSLVSRILKIKTLNTLDGLGATFEVNFLKRCIISYLIKLSQKKVNLFYFVNSSDLNFFIEKSYINKKKTKLINGTGIDLKFFKYKENKFSKKIKFLLISRLLYSKGVMNFLKSAEEITKKYKNKSSFFIAGIIDKSVSDQIPINILENEAKKSKTKIYYNVQNIKKLINYSNCVVLPTNYNEGFPRSLLESAAIGRPLITTNVPGCLRIAKNNMNAFVYKMSKNDQLTKNMMKFILLKKNKKIYMSKESNNIAKRFNVSKIIENYIKFLDDK